MRKVGGYLILSGIFGGFFGAMAWDLGFVNACIVTGAGVTLLGFMQLSVYLIMEGD